MKYYSTLRPIAPGGYPKAAEVKEIRNFDDKKYCYEIGCDAYGYIEYAAEIAETDAAAYELTPTGVKTYYCVMSSFDDRGRTAAAIVKTVQAKEKPADEYRSTSRKDIYVDWYPSLAEAERHVKTILNA